MCAEKNITTEEKFPPLTIEVAGENSLVIYFDTKASLAISTRVHAVAETIKEVMQQSIVDVIPSYASLLVIYDLHKTDFSGVSKAVLAISKKLGNTKNGSGKLIKLPVYYSRETGPDLDRLASEANLTIDDVIDIHQSREYRVYTIGFAPGFAYLGDVDKRIALPRLATPRKRVARGAVGIADRQTAVYPSESPGGWNLIGLCPQRMFDPSASPTMPVQIGDRIQFEAITVKQFLDLGGTL